MTTLTAITAALASSTPTILDATDDWNGTPMIRITTTLGDVDLTPEGHVPAAPSIDAWMSGALADIDADDIPEAVTAIYDAARVTVYDYATGDEIGTAAAETFARYLADIAGDDVGAVDGHDYGFRGAIYMQS